MSALVEGRVPVGEGRSLYYRRHGEGGRSFLPLHGGPGSGCEYLAPLAALAEPFGSVTLFEQLGAGRSDTSEDSADWSLEARVEEVEHVRRSLYLGRLDLFGQSWGGWLALMYALAYPEHVRTLTLSNTSASTAEYLMCVQELRTALGPEAHRTLLRSEATRRFDDPEYERVVLELNARHLRRAWPFDLDRSMAEVVELTESGMLAMGPAYERLWGPNEFVCTGPLLEFDVSSRISEIRAPTLILCGYYDEFTVRPSRTLADGIPDNEFVIFGNSSHMNTLEREADLYVDVVASFMRRH